jgi:hypothetical protein
MEKSPYNLNLLHCRRNHNLFMKRNERENKKNKENAVRLIVHSITHTPSSVINPRILFPFFLSLQFFHPSLINANYSCRRTFWNIPVNPAWRVPGFMEGGGKQITSVVTQFYCPLSPNSQTSEFFIYSFCTFKNFC